jgi:hypothetical protein
MASLFQKAFAQVNPFDQGASWNNAPQGLSWANNDYQNKLAKQDPKKVVNTVGGVNYNWAGDPIKSNKSSSNQKNSPNNVATPGLSSIYNTKSSSTSGNSGGRYGGGSGGSGGSSAPKVNADDLAYLDDQAARYRKELSRTKLAEQQGLRGISDQFNAETGKANRQRSRALVDFGIQRDTTLKNKNKTLGTIGDQARTLADSLRRRLGMAGGSDSSAYQIVAPGAVARDASGKRSDVLEDYGQNFRKLDLSEKRAKGDFASLLKDLSTQKRNSVRGFKQGILEQRNSISETLAEVARQRAMAQGGGYDKVRAAMKPYSTKINQRQNQISDLFDKYRNPYKVNPVNVDIPELADYTVDRAAISANNQAGTPSPYAPYRPNFKEDEALYN